jgi:aminomethyltransferase
MIKKTPFYDMHIKNNGRMVEFAGFYMPIQFEGIIPEHQTVRTAVGVFDVSHMGEVVIRGEDRVKFANYITTNDVIKLAMNQVQYSAMLYPDGGVVDDLLVYNLPDRIFIVVNAVNTDKDFKWITDNKKFNVAIANISDDIGQLAVQGPKAESVLQKLANFSLADLKYYWSTETELKGIPVLLSRTGYTGEDGFEIYADKKYAPAIWETVFEAGKEFGIKPIGLGARDTLRFEMRYCLYGNDIDQTTNALEAGLGWITKFDKGDFIGRGALLKIKEAGVNRKLVGFEAAGGGIPRPHLDIICQGRKAGHVTSGTFSPSLKKGIGMGYVETPCSEVGTKLQVMGKEPIEVMIVKGPFYKRTGHK